MSSEIEENPKEDTEDTKEGTRKKSLRQKARENWQVVFKILELVISLICVSFIYEPAKVTGLGKSNLHHVGIMYTAYTGYILINTVLLLGRYMGDRLSYKTSVVFSICGASIYLITGILLIADRAHLTKHYFYHPKAYLMAMMTTSIVFALVNVLVFGIDSVVTFRRREDL